MPLRRANAVRCPEICCAPDVCHPNENIKYICPFVRTDHDRFGHRVRVVEQRQRRRSESDVVGVQLAARVAHRVDGRTADAVGRGEKHREPGEDVHRQPEDGRVQAGRRRRRRRRGTREGRRRTG